jgi:hypothetical protein
MSASAPMRVIDIEGLGQPALIVNTSGPRLLLLDARRRAGEDDMIAGVLVIDVPGLGRPAQIVKTSKPRLLLLDTALSDDERIRIMSTLIDGPEANQ